MTLEASSEIVLAMTAPQPSSKALPITFAFVPGGPEPMTNGLGSFNPLTVVASVGITWLQNTVTRDGDRVYHNRSRAARGCPEHSAGGNNAAANGALRISEITRRGQCDCTSFPGH